MEKIIEKGIKLLNVDTSTVKMNVPPSYIMMRYLTCDCGETFYTESDLHTHFLETDHKFITRDISTYQCNLCTKVFDTERFVLQHHRMIHHFSLTDKRRRTMNKSKYDPSQPCEICGKVLKNKFSIWLHMKTHSGIKPHKCNYCDKAFTFKDNLKKHTYSHTGERPFACTICPMAFGTPSNLIRHRRIHAGLKPHKCKLCPNRYISNSELKNHVDTVHLKIKSPYKRKPRGTGRPRMTITNYHNFINT